MAVNPGVNRIYAETIADLCWYAEQKQHLCDKYAEKINAAKSHCLQFI